MASKYVYGIIPIGEVVRFEPSDPAEDAHVVSIPYQGLACVVQGYAGPAFSELTREALVHRLLAHQAVCERVMERFTILPAKLGTVLEGEEVLELLQQGYTRFTQSLAQLEGKWEFEVAATWDLDWVFREISQEEEIGQLRERLAGSPLGGTLEQRALLGKMVKDSLERRREHFRRPMLDYLKDLAVDFQENALLRDELVLNVALLIERSAEEELARRVGELDHRFHQQINFRIIGPLPPYSFSTVEITRPALEALEEARLILGLGTQVSVSEIQQAYRKLVAASHPDVNRQDPGAAEVVNRLTQAATLLTGYCRGQDTGTLDVSQGRISLVPNGGKAPLVVTIKRAAAQPPISDPDLSFNRGVSSSPGLVENMPISPLMVSLSNHERTKSPYIPLCKGGLRGLPPFDKSCPERSRRVRVSGKDSTEPPHPNPLPSGERGLQDN